MTLNDFTVTVDGVDYPIKCIRHGNSWDDISYNFSTTVDGVERMLECDAPNELIHDLAVIMGFDLEQLLTDFMTTEIETEIKRKLRNV